MHALASTFAHRLLAAAALLLTPACRTGSTPFQLPPRTQVPPHACADWGVKSCESACEAQSDGDACLVASVAYAAGIGVRKDSAAMERLELRACELGVALGCENYANNFRRSADPDEAELARVYYERACDGGRPESCAWAGTLALRLDANAEPRDLGTAVARHQQACDGGVAWACATLGGTLQGWHMRARPGRTLAHPVCVLNVFDIQA